MTVPSDTSVPPDDRPTVSPGPDGRPVTRLPNRELVRISLYWLGLSSIFAGLSSIMAGRLEFTDLVDKGEAGRALFFISISGVIIAILVQPTIGSICDYTISRLGPAQAVHLHRVARSTSSSWSGSPRATPCSRSRRSSRCSSSARTSPRGRSRGTSRISSRRRRSGLASALVGLMQVLGVVLGLHHRRSRDRDPQLRSRAGLPRRPRIRDHAARWSSAFVRARSPRSREGRPWRSIAAEAWGTDILKEHSFLWLVGSRLVILTGGAVLTQLATFYLARAMGLGEKDAGLVLIPLVALVAVGTVTSVIPAAKISDRVGRKRVICGELCLGSGRPRDRGGRPDPAGRLPGSAARTGSAPARSSRSTGRS